MTYAPPLIKPPLPPLRPPVAPPYRPPGTNPLPPNQTAPIYQPPNLLPPTEVDLKGIVCIYSNAPIWEPKKIKYRYPGENWQEIVGDRYTTQISNIAGGNDFKTWVIDVGSVQISSGIILYLHYRPCTDPLPAKIYTTKNIYPSFFTGKVVNVQRATLVVDNCGDIGGDVFGGDWLFIDYVDSFNILRQHLVSNYEAIPLDPPYEIRRNRYFTFVSHDFSLRLREENKPPPPFPCIFKVFDIFNQEILSITRDDCPEVIVVPERCYFKPENERLVARVIQSLLDPPLRVKYQGHCATVWKDSWPLNYFPVQIYKECSDNPNCSPPRIRFDKKCEETCEQCPPGTAIKVLLGSRIACVDAFGCIKKMIKYKFGCNNYDCICN